MRSRSRLLLGVLLGSMERGFTRCLLVTPGKSSSYRALSPSLDLESGLSWHQGTHCPCRGPPSLALSAGCPRNICGVDSGSVVSSVWLITILWIAARQAPLSMGFSRREYWSGLSFSSSVDLLDPGIKPTYPTLAGRFFTYKPPGKPHSLLIPPSKPLSSPPPSYAFSFSKLSLCETHLLFFQAYLTITWELSWLNKLLEWLRRSPLCIWFSFVKGKYCIRQSPQPFPVPTSCDCKQPWSLPLPYVPLAAVSFVFIEDWFAVSTILLCFYPWIFATCAIYMVQPIL